MLIMAAAMTVSCAMAAEITYDTGITVMVDGNKVQFDQQPVIADDRTLVPVRAIFEALGAEVDWVADTRTVVSTKDENKCELVIDSNEMKVGDETVTLDVPAMIINDRTLVPVRAISEAYGCNVEWEADTKTVIITSAMSELSPSPEPTTIPEPTVTPEPTATPKPTATPSPEPITQAFTDKTICLYGDDTVSAAKQWKEMVKLAFSPKAFESVTPGRKPMVISTGDDLGSSTYINKIPDDADYVLVMAGIADWAWNFYGENTENSQNSFEEGIENVAFNISRRVPDAQIIFVTQPYITIRSERIEPNGVYNERGLSPAGMAEITKEFADRNGYEVIDLYNESGINAENYKEYMKNTTDSYIYPNDEGCKLISEVVIKRLMEINPEQ